MTPLKCFSSKIKAGVKKAHPTKNSTNKKCPNAGKLIKLLYDTISKSLEAMFLPPVCGVGGMSQMDAEPGQKDWVLENQSKAIRKIINTMAEEKKKEKKHKQKKRTRKKYC